MGYVSTMPIISSFFLKKNRQVRQVALGEAHTVVLDDCGSVYTFGWGELGQLGINTNIMESASN